MRKLITMGISALFTISLWGYDVGDYSYSYNMSTKEGTITGYSGTSSVISIPTSFSVPETYKDEDDGEMHTRYHTIHVVGIGSSVFANKTFIKSVSFHSKLKSVGSSAFSGCTGIVGVDLSTVETIGDNAFRGCTSLTDIDIPSSVSSMGSGIFESCTKLTEVRFHNDLRGTIPSRLFNGCANLVSVSISIPNVSSIGDYAFSGCKSLGFGNVDFNNLKSVGAYAFQECLGLTGVTFSSGLTSIGEHAFDSCANLSQTLETPSTLKSFGSFAFTKCSGLTQIVIDGNGVSVGAGAFSECSNIVDVVIGDGVVGIAGNMWRPNECAFHNCGKIKTIHVGVGVTIIGQSVFEDLGALEYIEFDGKLTEIGMYAFYGCGVLETLRAPNAHLTRIADLAFGWCSQLPKLDCSLEYVISIGEMAFEFCGQFSLDGVAFQSLESVSRLAFWDCSGITTLKFGPKLKSFTSNAFADCNNLNSVTFTGPPPEVGTHMFSPGAVFEGCASGAHGYYPPAYAAEWQAVINPSAKTWQGLIMEEIPRPILNAPVVNAADATVDLSWSMDYASANLRFDVYRSASGDFSTASVIGTNIGEKTFKDETWLQVRPNEGSLYYWVVARDGDCEISRSDSVRGEVGLAEIKLTGTTDQNDVVKLTWTVENCTGPFTIYRGETEAAVRNPMLRTAVVRDFDKFTYVDDRVCAGQNYYYQIVSSGGVESPVERRSVLTEPVSIKKVTLRSVRNGLNHPVETLMEERDVVECIVEFDNHSDYPLQVDAIEVVGRSERRDDCEREEHRIVWNRGAFNREPSWAAESEKVLLSNFKVQGETGFDLVLGCAKVYGVFNLLKKPRGGGHGNYVWHIKCRCCIGKNEPFFVGTKFTQPVYFNPTLKSHEDNVLTFVGDGWNPVPVIGQGYVPNWFHYWRIDGAVERGDRVAYWSGVFSLKCYEKEALIVLGDGAYASEDVNIGAAWGLPTCCGVAHADFLIRKGKMQIDLYKQYHQKSWDHHVKGVIGSRGSKKIPFTCTCECGRQIQVDDKVSCNDSDARVELGPGARITSEIGWFKIVHNVEGYFELQTDFLTDQQEISRNKNHPEVTFDVERTTSVCPSYNISGFTQGAPYVVDGEVECHYEAGKTANLGRYDNDWSFPRINYDGKHRLGQARMLTAGGLPMSNEFDSDNEDEIRLIDVSYVQPIERLVSNLLFVVSAEVTGSQSYEIVGVLRNAQSNVVACASADLQPGENHVSLSFDSQRVYAFGGDAPYCMDEIVVRTIKGVEVGACSGMGISCEGLARENLAHPCCHVLASPIEESLTESNLVLTVAISVEKEGDYEVCGILATTNCAYVAESDYLCRHFSEGVSNVELSFGLDEIYYSGLNGPFVLERVTILENGEYISALVNAYTTSVSYASSDFIPTGTTVVVERESAAFDCEKRFNGELGNLVFSFDVYCGFPVVSQYAVSGSLFGTNDELVASVFGQWVNLTNGVNHVELTFSSAQISSSGIDGPYWMGVVELIPQADEKGNAVSFHPAVQTPSYKASDFAAAAVAFSNEPSAKGVLECDTPTVVLPFEAKRACTVVASATLIGTNGEFIARASATNRCDATGAQTAEIVFPREALVAAGQQGPFSVGYFALLPLVDGEEPIYSDTFEVTGVEWIDWEGMFDWAFEGGTAQAALYKGTNGVVRVPSFVKGRDVISVGPCCFLDCECVAEIVLPVGIADVGIGAFFGTSLSAVELPESVATVGNAAFNVEGLELVVFDGPPPMSAPDAYPKGAVGTYSAAYAAAWEAELKGGCLWNGLTMVPEGADADGYRTESGWTVVGPEDAAACEGKRTFRSAQTLDGTSSSLNMSVNEPSTVSFWWRTSCEGDTMDDSKGDHAEFLVDGAVVAQLAGESCWKQVFVDISEPGSHELTWRYVKDGVGASGADCVWVSEVDSVTVAGEMTRVELPPEIEYNWFYENEPVVWNGENPFEYVPETSSPECMVSQIDLICDPGVVNVVGEGIEHELQEAQVAICRWGIGGGLDFAVWTADGWIRVGNDSLGKRDGEIRITFCVDYSIAPSRFTCKVDNHTLTNEAGQSSFVCAKQDQRVNAMIVALERVGAGCIEAWAGRYDASNSEILEIAEGTEAECDSDLSNLPRETFQVSGGGTLVIRGEDVPAAGVKARLHVDQNSALRFDYSTFSSLPSVLTLFSGIGNDFMLGGNVSIAVPGEGTDRLSKLCVKDGNLEAHIAERPEIVTEGGSKSPFAVDGENGSASLNVGNAVEGFWYGLLTTGVLTSDFVLDPDSVKQCTGTGSLRLESSANANSDSGFYRVSVSAEKP